MLTKEQKQRIKREAVAEVVRDMLELQLSLESGPSELVLKTAADMLEDAVEGRR